MKSAVQHRLNNSKPPAEEKAFPMTAQTTNLMTDIDKRIDAAFAGSQPVRYISGDEMAYLRSRAVTLRAEASRDFFHKLAGLFRGRPSDWVSGSVAAAK